MANNILLTDAQKSAIDCTDGHLQIIACAGSGKTEVISRRIANILQSKSDVRPENIVAFTFTEKAAESLKSRIENVLCNQIPGMYVGTIHGFCKYILSKYTEDFANFKILDTVKNHHFINRYADQCGMTDLGLKSCPLNNNLFLQCIDKLIDDYDNREHWGNAQQSVLEKYTHCLYDHHYIDFSLLLFEALRQIETNASVQEYLKSIKHLVVDEYQDVNDLQEKLIRAIANHGANVCVVGDDDQTIYQFRGSNADNMISFSNRYEGAIKIRLEENFRSQNGIVDIAARVILNNRHRLDKQMLAKAPKAEGTIEAHGYSSTDEEFTAIAKKIAELHEDGLPYKDIAVLVRKGKYVPQIANKLAESGIPFVADSAEDFFGGAYFRRFVETLRILESIDKAALYEQWKDVVDGTQFNIGFKYLRSRTRGGQYRLSEILRGFCEAIEFLNPLASDLKVRIEDLEGISTILDDYDEIYGDYQLSYRITGLLRFLGEYAREEYKYHNFRENAHDDAVQIMTVHKSKGLEFHTVFLPRLNKRDFPVSNMGGKKYYHVLGGTFVDNKDRYDSDIEDERKLFYVAVTRAKNNLFLSYTFEKQEVSCFVAESAESSCLKIDKNDLYYEPPHAERSTRSVYQERSSDGNDQRQQWEQERAEREQYRQIVAYAREALHDDYYVANHFCPGIILEFSDICKKGDEAILAKAREKGLI